MSSSVNAWICTECGDEEAMNESFNDSEKGHILECVKGCGYLEIYREDAKTGKILQNYSGYKPYESVLNK